MVGYSIYTKATTGKVGIRQEYGGVLLQQGTARHEEFWMLCLQLFAPLQFARWGYRGPPHCRLSQGLPNGPFGLLGAAEGVSYLAILAGLVVLGFQVTDYGYIPNAIPVEGGKCA